MHNNYRHVRRFLRFNAIAALLLAAALLVMLNYLAAQYPWRHDFSRGRYFALSPVTLELLERAPAHVTITALMAPEHELARDVRGLLREYAYATSKVRVEHIDPNRDLTRSKELALRFDVRASDQLIIEVLGRVSTVPLRELAEYDYTPVFAGRSRRMIAFRGEQVISAAINGLLRERQPVVGFLTGHGEKSIDNYDPLDGYSMIARQIQRHNYAVETVRLEAGTLPTCDALVIAGPTRRLIHAELELIRAYLKKANRVFLLLDSGVDAGLNELLADWGVRAGDDRVVGLTLTGRELLIANYGDHPITARMKHITTIFNMPRSIQPLAVTDTLADRPRTTLLALTTEKGWADTSAFQNPPKFDPETDQPGPIPVALAVERGLAEAINVELKPARLVVFGDSTLVANGALTAGYNSDLFLNSLNWLLDTGEGLNIAARSPPTIRVNMNIDRLRLLFLLLAGALPLAAMITGGVVRWCRRR